MKTNTGLDFLNGGGEMGERMRAFDWSNVSGAAHRNGPLRFANRLWLERWQRRFDDFRRDGIRGRRHGMRRRWQGHGVGKGRGYVGLHHEVLSWLGDGMFWMTFRSHSLRVTDELAALVHSDKPVRQRRVWLACSSLRRTPQATGGVRSSAKSHSLFGQGPMPMTAASHSRSVPDSLP